MKGKAFLGTLLCSTLIISSLMTVPSYAIGEKFNGTYKVERVSGGNRYATSVALAEKFIEETDLGKVDTIMIANGYATIDASMASPLSIVKNAPILLSSKDKACYEVVNFLDKHFEIKNIIILGEKGVISAEQEEFYRNRGLNVKRLGGLNRYETNVKIINEIPKDMLGGIPVILDGNDIWQALIASSISRLDVNEKTYVAPIVLIDPSKISIDTLESDDYKSKISIASDALNRTVNELNIDAMAGISENISYKIIQTLASEYDSKHPNDDKTSLEYKEKMAEGIFDKLLQYEGSNVEKKVIFRAALDFTSSDQKLQWANLQMVYWNLTNYDYSSMKGKNSQSSIVVTRNSYGDLTSASSYAALKGSKIVLVDPDQRGYKKQFGLDDNDNFNLVSQFFENTDRLIFIGGESITPKDMVIKALTGEEH